MIVFLLSLATVALASDQCIWYGVCYTEEISEDISHSFNCPSNDTNKYGKVIEDENAINIMKERCPEVFGNGKINTVFFFK